MSAADKNSAEWREALVLAYQQGTSTQEIAAKFNCGAGYPGALAKRAGVRLRGSGPTWKRRQEGRDPWWWKEPC